MLNQHDKLCSSQILKCTHFLDEEFVNLHFEKQMNKVKNVGKFSCNKDNLTNFNFTLFNFFLFFFYYAISFKSSKGYRIPSDEKFCLNFDFWLIVMVLV